MDHISILLSDFQFLTKEGLISLVGKHEGIEVVGTEDKLDNLIHTLNEKTPDVLVLDYRPDVKNFGEVLKEIKSSTTAKILILTSDTDKERIREILKTGVKGMITKTCSEQEIINSIRAVSEGNRFYCNKILDIVMEHQDHEEEEEDCEPTDLTPREFDVLKLITKGYTTNKIADKLHVSVHTINSHRKNILKKLNLKSPTELVVYALESGLVK